MFRKQRSQFGKERGHLRIVHGRSLFTQLPDPIFDEVYFHNYQHIRRAEMQEQYRRVCSLGNIVVEGLC